MGAPDFVVHHPADSVGVVVVDRVAPGQRLTGWIMEGDQTIELAAADEVPLGHKLALRAIGADETVVKYGEDIGRTIAPVGIGGHVHVHNLKTKRW